MYKSILEREFERHPIRRKSISWIELRFTDGYSMPIKVQAMTRGIQRNAKRPISFIWHNPEAVSVTPSLIDWIQSEFRPMFDSDPIMWTVSSYTAPKKLQSILLGMQ